MNCRRVNNLLSAYVDSELPGVDQLQIRDHLKTCPACSEEYDSLLTTKRMLSQLSLKQPRVDLEQKILDCLAQESGRRPALVPTTWWGLLPEPQKASLRAAAMFAVFSLVAGVYVYSPLGRTPLQSGALNVAAEPAPVQQAHSVPVRDYLMLHNSSEDSLPMRSGPSITPAGMYSPGFAGAR